MRKKLIVIDMQNDFIDGSLGTPEAVAIVPKVLEKIHSYPVEEIIFTRDTHEENYLETKEGKYLPVEHCIRGTEGWQIRPELQIAGQGAAVFDKPTFGSVELASYITMINEMEPDYVGLLTLMIDPDVPIAEEIRTGRLELLSPEEVVAETLLLMENTNVDPDHPCVFRSNHASNYLSLRGDLPKDKDAFMALLKKAAEDTGMLKDERWRAL